jgi:flavin-dependent dehydrogenase
MAAKYAAKAGASTLIIEENSAIGEPVQCAGLISKRAIEESELKNIGSFVNCELKGAIVHSQSHELRIEVPSPEKSAFAIRRDIFDKELAKAAMDGGAELKRGGEGWRKANDTGCCYYQRRCKFRGKRDKGKRGHWR